MKTWTTILEEGGEGGYILPLPDETCSQLGWELGDEIQVHAENGLITLINISIERLLERKPK
jgi:hypothetical protein